MYVCSFQTDKADPQWADFSLVYLILSCKLRTSSDFLETYILFSCNIYCDFIDIVFLVMLQLHL